MPDTQYYFSPTGEFLGGFLGTDPPEGSILYGTTAPAHGLDTWLNGVYTSYVAPIPVGQQLYALFLSLSVADQVQYSPYLGTIMSLVDKGLLDEAKLIISGLTVSTEDQTVQSQMVTILGE